MLLLLLAWSSVAFNLREVYNRVMRAVTEMPDEDTLFKVLHRHLAAQATCEPRDAKARTVDGWWAVQGLNL